MAAHKRSAAALTPSAIARPKRRNRPKRPKRFRQIVPLERHLHVEARDDEEQIDGHGGCDQPQQRRSELAAMVDHDGEREEKSQKAQDAAPGMTPTIKARPPCDASLRSAAWSCSGLSCWSAVWSRKE
jgi:hypothetical protein